MKREFPEVPLVGVGAIILEDSRVVLLNNCGHWAPFEKPAEWTAHVLSFLKGY